MHISIIAPGSQGDVQPFLALGKGLVKAGNVVRLVTNQNYEEQVKIHGIEFWPIEVNMEDIIRTEKMREVLESGKLLTSIARMGNELKQHSALLAKRSLAACKDMDFIMAGISGLFTANSIAEKLELPLIQALNIPFTPTKEFKGVLLPKFPNSRLSHRLTQQIVWQAYRPTDKVVRNQILGLSKSPFSGPFKSESLRDGTIIYGISPSVLSRPKDWGKNIHITGFWSLDPPESWVPPSDLMNFLQNGHTPLYIGFGSMSSKDPEETANLVFKVLKSTNQRAIVLSGWGGLKKTELPDSVLMVDSIPHSWLFPRVEAVIHHGGAGTTAAGLTAGVPSIIIPFHGDQPYWGSLVTKLGVGPKPIPRNKLSEKKLRNAIQEINTNQRIREEAAELGTKIQAEDGIAKAIDIIKKLAKN
jgi:UDP:flavonoid glycosyltransferase YjiC (YdhE family)